MKTAAILVSVVGLATAGPTYPKCDEVGLQLHDQVLPVGIDMTDCRYTECKEADNGRYHCPLECDNKAIGHAVFNSQSDLHDLLRNQRVFRVGEFKEKCPYIPDKFEEGFKYPNDSEFKDCMEVGLQVNRSYLYWLVVTDAACAAQKCMTNQFSTGCAIMCSGTRFGEVRFSNSSDADQFIEEQKSNKVGEFQDCQD
ncbi:hypothetical protein CDD83_9974 [Cordyceps sp. RAO-2017]|nr:hypothetical protein CDD83_9974 [Cordyceps sp. RAO-2017]